MSHSFVSGSGIKIYGIIECSKQGSIPVGAIIDLKSTSFLMHSILMHMHVARVKVLQLGLSCWHIFPCTPDET